MSQQSQIEQEEDTQKDRYLTFTVKGEEFALAIQYINEILELQSVTAVPNLPDYIKGIINVRGEILPIMDLRTRFYGGTAENDYRNAILSVDIGGKKLGFIVDRANKVLLISESALHKPPEIRDSDYNRFVMAVCHIDGSMKLILDCEKILSDRETELLPNQVKTAEGKGTNA